MTILFFIIFLNDLFGRWKSRRLIGEPERTRLVVCVCMCVIDDVRQRSPTLEFSIKVPFYTRMEKNVSRDKLKKN